MSDKLSLSLDAIIKSSGGGGKGKGGGKGGGRKGGGGGGSGGRGRNRLARARAAPYSRPDTSDKERKGRGNFRFGSGSGGGGGGGGEGGGGAEAVFVGGLAPTVDWRALKDHMRQAGEVVRADVVEGRGFGICTFATAAEAKVAISTLNDTELEGKSIAVRADKGGGRSGSGGAGGGGGGGGGHRTGGGDSGDAIYTKARNGWVKPTGENFDDAPPPDPKNMLGA